jgi:hypothetical protein
MFQVIDFERTDPWRFVMEPLEGGEEVQIVWKASTGGKTQTLQRYTVQTGSPDPPGPYD